MNLPASADAASSLGARPNIVPHTAPPCSCRTSTTGRQAAVTEALDQVEAMVPALLFLCVGVPLASLLDRLGYFEAVASLMQQRAGAIRLGWLWMLACATTAVLNLDTTVVLLTPLYIRL